MPYYTNRVYITHFPTHYICLLRVNLHRTGSGYSEADISLKICSKHKTVSLWKGIFLYTRWREQTVCRCRCSLYNICIALSFNYICIALSLKVVCSNSSKCLSFEHKHFIPFPAKKNCSLFSFWPQVKVNLNCQKMHVNL